MTTDINELFRQLEPPPGGAERFRQQLEQRNMGVGRSMRYPLVAGLAASAVLAIAVFGLLQQRDDPELMAGVYQAPEFDRLLGRSPQPAGMSVAIDETPVAVSEVATSNPRIRVYWIERE